MTQNNNGEFQIADVPAEYFINELSKKLKGTEIIEAPTWSKFVKTGSDRERPPVQEDWWYTRAASILRRIYLKGPIGVERLRKYYGGRKRRGTRPPKKEKTGGKIIRKILQQLEAAGFVIKVRKGRKINSKGESLLSEIAEQFKEEWNGGILR